jgi:hypothetical protein
MEFGIGLVGLHQAVIREHRRGGSQAEGKQQRLFGLVHGSTCEIGFRAFPQGL